MVLLRMRQMFKIHAVDLIMMAALRVEVFQQTSRKVQVKKRSFAKPTSAKPLVTVPFENGFHFYTALGSDTGITATNLNEFAAKLQVIPMESIIFHFQRKDFQQWMKDAIKDAELAEQMNRIKQGLRPEDLRKEILSTVKAYTA